MLRFIKRNSIVQNLKQGFRDSLPMSYQVPLAFWASKLRGHLEPEMILLTKLVNAQDIAIDVGSNRGIYAFYLARIGARVHLFEPNPDCIRILRSWASRKPHVVVHPVALSDENGYARLLIPVDCEGIQHDASATIEKSRTGNCQEQIVPSATLDSFRFDQIALIKIDVEGHEFSVLQGGLKTIARDRPALLIEIEKRHLVRSFSASFDLLHKEGYKSYFLDRGRLREFSEFDIKTHQCTTNIGRHDSSYINNFLFLHRSLVDKGIYAGILNR